MQSEESRQFTESDSLAALILLNMAFPEHVSGESLKSFKPTSLYAMAQKVETHD